MRISLILLLGLILCPHIILAAENTTYRPERSVDINNVPNPFISKIPKEAVVVPTPAKSESPAAPSFYNPALPVPPVPPPVARSAEEPEAPINVQGVIWESEKPQAIINDQIVGIGDQVGKAKVTSIAKSQVVLSYPNKTVTFEIH
jgi:hypothetical protein